MLGSQQRYFTLLENLSINRTSPLYRGFFDPEVQRIIQFDQRGCGKSTPFGSIEENTTWDLVEDIEKLRIHFGIDKWHVVFGAESHPERVSHLVLRGVFLSRKQENDFIYKNGTGLLFPEEFNNLKQLMKNRRTYCTVIFEMTASKLLPSDILQIHQKIFSKLFLWLFWKLRYLDNICFLRNENQLIEDINKIKHIPTIIVQGIYDALCPVKSAWELSTLLDPCELVIVPDSGHSCTELGTIDGLVKATNKFKKRI
ncbi:hypothetical protein ABPG72_020414 [Tetrahymena utriculariae]